MRILLNTALYDLVDLVDQCVSVGAISGELLAAIMRDFGSFDNFKDQLTTKTVAIQGSGWGWLVS